MFKENFKEEILKSIFQYSIILLVIFGSADTIPVGAHYILRFATQIVLCAVVAIVSFIKKTEKKSLIISGVLSLVILLSMICNDDWRGYSMWIIMLIGAFISEIIEFEDFMKKLDDVIFIIALASLIGSIVLLLYPPLYDNLSIVNSGGRYKNMFFMVVPTNLISDDFRIFFKDYRNYGIFREPAMFCIYLGFALIRQWIFESKPSSLRVIVLLLTMFSTKSMTGYVATAFLIVIYVFLNRRNKKVLIVTGSVFSIGMVIAAKCDVLWYIAQRFNINGDSRHSIISRLYSVLAGLLVGKDNILLGAGATKSQVLFDEYASRLVTDMGVCWANMITYLFASFGIIFVSVFLLGIWGVGLYSHKGIIACWSIFFFWALLLCGEIMTYSSIMYIFMMYGWKKLIERGMKCQRLKYRC